MKVLVVGGGIAGCSVAALLRKYQVAEVTLVEKAPEFRNIGFLIAFWGTGRKILKELEIEHKIDAHAYEYRAENVLDKRGRLMKIIRPGPVNETAGIPVVIKRADLHRNLFDLLQGADVRFNTTVTRMEQKPNGVSVEMSGERTEFFDLVIGADGVRSTVREQVFGSDFLHYYGWGAWIWWMPENYARPKDPIGYYGSGKTCGVGPFLIHQSRSRSPQYRPAPGATQRCARVSCAINSATFARVRKRL